MSIVNYGVIFRVDEENLSIDLLYCLENVYDKGVKLGLFLKVFFQITQKGL